jgi:hypothetical protein
MARKLKRPRKSKPRQSSTHFFLIPGVWYVMVNFPLVCFVKSGITGGNAFDRAKQIDRDAPGWPIPIFFVVTFFHYELEQWSHRAFKSLSVRYYKGDGHTEWFWLPAGVFIILVQASLWVFYLWVLELFTGIPLLRILLKIVWGVKSIR